jgi:peptide/nickel transport system permease protein
MTVYIVRRLLIFVPTLFVTALLIFLMIYLIPGDPSILMAGQEATQEEIQRVREQLGLNRPFGVRMIEWFGQVLQGNLGASHFMAMPVSQALAERFPVTLGLAFQAWFISAVLGIAAGVIAGVRHGRFLDWGVMLLAVLGVSVPVFWLGLNMIVIFSVTLGLLPTGGYVPFTESPIDYARYMLMPALVLGITHAAVVARMTRSSMIEVLSQDFVRTARAKGLRERVVILRHALRNALIPIITILGIIVGELIAGSVITETVFNLPGVGRLIIEAVKRRDYPVIQGGILLVTVGFLTVNLLVDIVYAWANPRIRYG